MKNILIIEPSTSGLNLLPTAYRLGLNVIVLTANTDERIIPNLYKKYIFKAVHVDTNDLNALCAVTLKVHSRLPISAVIPGFEIFVAHAAYLSQLIGVPGVSQLTGKLLRDKGLMREALQKAGVRIPRFSIVESIKNIQEKVNYIGFPCVLKPLDQSGSMHVSKATSNQELIQAYQNMCQDKWTEMNKGIGSIAILEEYISGEEFSVEGFVQENKINIISITKKFLGPEPYFVEMGHIVHAHLSVEICKNIKDYIEDVIKALHFNIGIFHCELRITDKGPVLMEIAGRLAGDRIPDLILLATGSNLYELMLQVLLGQKVESNLRKRKPLYAGIKFFAPDIRTYQNIEGVNKIQEFEGYQEFKILIKPNELIPPLKNFLGRIGFCIFTALSYEKLLLTFDEVDRTIQFIQ